MSFSDLLWLATACYALHILEEYQLNWRDWARAVIKLPVEWSDFYVVNALVVVLGVTAAHLAATQATLALAFPGVMLINATFFHVLPFLRTRGRFSPGLITAVILFYPVGIACYGRALSSGAIGAPGIVLSLILGALLMASPVVLLMIKDKAYFRQAN